MAGRKMDPSRAVDPRRWEVFRAAGQIRAEGKERVALRSVWTRVKRNVGVAGNNQLVGAYLSEWAEERGYSSRMISRVESCLHEGKWARGP